MRTYARIENGTVAEIIPALMDANGVEYPINSRFTADIAGTIVEALPEAAPGWTYANGAFSAPSAAPAAVVPAAISPAQARIALHNAGLLDRVEAAVAAADIVTQIAWAQATSIERASPTVAALAAALGLTDVQLDSLFTAAAAIRV